MKADLERRVHELLDAGREPAEDAQVRTALADDPEARDEVAALSKLEGWLRDWEVSVPEEDLEPIAQRIEQRLDEPMDSIDATAPPEFDDPDARVSPLAGDRSAGRSGEYSLDALAGAVDAPAPAQLTGPSPAVALSAPPRESKPRTPLAPWIAAAAVVGLGVMVSVATLKQADEPAPAAGAPSQEAQALPTSPAEASGDFEPAMEELDEAEEAEAEPREEAAAELAEESPAPSGGGATSTGTTATEGMARSEPAPTRRRSRSTAMTAATPQAAALDDVVGGAGGAGVRRAGAGEAEGRQAVERSRAGVRACLGSSFASAVVMVRFHDGTVRDARVIRPATNDATNQCVAAALRRARVRPEGQQSRRTLYYRWPSLPDNAYGN